MTIYKSKELITLKKIHCGKMTHYKLRWRAVQVLHVAQVPGRSRYAHEAIKNENAETRRARREEEK